MTEQPNHPNASVLVQETRELFTKQFGGAPEAISQAPGRVEILGNHTDYNGGHVLTVAIDRTIAIAGSRNDSDVVRVFSNVIGEMTEFPIHSLKHDDASPWTDYVKGVADQVQKLGVTLGGFDAVICGDLPIGAGVSSSAALETSTALLLKALFPYDIEPMELAQLCRRAENEFVGMPCGLLDQFTSTFGKDNAMLWLDCDTLEHEAFVMPTPAPKIVLCHSGVKHKLVEGEYKSRRDQCVEAARVLGEKTGKSPRFLRDITYEEFLQYQSELKPVVQRRAQHIMEENRRVLAGVEALKSGDLVQLGKCIFESHASSRDLFENTCPELDILIEEAKQIAGCYGAKMTGGGFGGATVNLIEASKIDAFTKTITARYKDRTGLSCNPMICEAASGARILDC
ncbi:MAG: galactokinase [Candidatus Hinthialibacter antarcticus]|nr:galactokinase [Candidatus Hinthialibacter antarcticus]